MCLRSHSCVCTQTLSCMWDPPHIPPSVGKRADETRRDRDSRTLASCLWLMASRQAVGLVGPYPACPTRSAQRSSHAGLLLSRFGFFLPSGGRREAATISNRLATGYGFHYMKRVGKEGELQGKGGARFPIAKRTRVPRATIEKGETCWRARSTGGGGAEGGKNASRWGRRVHKRKEGRRGTIWQRRLWVSLRSAGNDDVSEKLVVETRRCVTAVSLSLAMTRGASQ